MVPIKLHNNQKGMLFMIGAAFFFSLMNLCAKAAGDLPSIQKAFFRNSIAAFISCTVLLRTKRFHVPHGRNSVFLVLRAVLGTAGLIANFYGVSHLTLADASILAKLAPFFTLFFSYLFLKEAVRPYQLAGALCAFSASLLIIKPAFAESHHTIAATIACLGGMCAGGAHTCVRYLLLRKEFGPYIVFFFSAFSTLFLLPFFIFWYQPMTLTQLLLLLCTGLAGAGGQFTVTAAYSYAPAKHIAVFDYTQILFSALFGLFLFSELPDGYSLIGYTLICSIAVFLFLHRKHESEEPFIDVHC